MHLMFELGGQVLSDLTELQADLGLDWDWAPIPHCDLMHLGFPVFELGGHVLSDLTELQEDWGLDWDWAPIPH